MKDIHVVCSDRLLQHTQTHASIVSRRQQHVLCHNVQYVFSHMLVLPWHCCKQKMKTTTVVVLTAMVEHWQSTELTDLSDEENKPMIT